MAVLVLFLHMDDNRSNVLEIIRLVCGCAIALLFNLGSNISTPNLFHRQIPPQCLQPRMLGAALLHGQLHHHHRRARGLAGERVLINAWPSAWD